MPKLFGTDGIRGVANVELTPELALALGRAAAEVLGAGFAKPRVLVGRDTRVSGDMLASAVAAGCLSAGAGVIRGRVLPTPAVAHLVTELSACAGAVISASHNPATDNGIKFFGPDGFKLTEEKEEEIESRLGSELNRPLGENIGRLEFVPDADERYVNHALKALDGVSLKGLRIVVDCANGAAFQTTPKALEQSGAEVLVIGAEPDGLNINEGCGSLHPEVVAAEVVDKKANLGLSHDGDADRMIAVDENGSIVDGDIMLGALAIDMKKRDRLTNNLAVTTVMANLGLKKAMAAEGIDLVETDVGDRYVLEAMRKQGACVGGEQSGHLIFLDNATTGDGLVTALKLAGLMARTGRPLSEISSPITKYPQVLINIKTSGRERLQACEPIWNTVRRTEDEMGTEGRVLVRASGTEPLVRVMVEAASQELARSWAGDIGEVIRRELGDTEGMS